MCGRVESFSGECRRNNTLNLWKCDVDVDAAGVAGIVVDIEKSRTAENGVAHVEVSIRPRLVGSCAETTGIAGVDARPLADIVPMTTVSKQRVLNGYMLRATGKTCTIRFRAKRACKDCCT